MLEIITFKGKNNRKQFIAYSEELRKNKVFHSGTLLDNESVICYTNNIRGLNKLQEEE